MKTLRCSSLDSLFLCPPSILEDGPDVVRIQGGQYGEAALLGTVCHEAAAGIVNGNGYDLDEIVERTGLSEKSAKEVPMLMSYAGKAWSELSQFLPEPQY